MTDNYDDYYEEYEKNKAMFDGAYGDEYGNEAFIADYDGTEYFDETAT